MPRLALTALYRSFTRDKLYAALTIGGLAVGIATFLVLALYVRFETGFERWLPRYDRVYRVDTAVQFPGSPFNGAYPATMPGMLEQMRDDFPGLIGTRIRGGDRATGEHGGAVVRGGIATTEDVAQVDPGFFQVFALPMVQGDGARALADPTAALLSRSAARRYFGSADPIGQTITVSMDAPANYRVAGVFEDLPRNSELHLAILIPIPKTPPPGEWAWYKWGTASVTTWLRFETPEAAQAFAAKLPAFIDRRSKADFGPGASKWISLPLVPLADTHLKPMGSESASRQLMVTTLGSIGLLTLLIGIVNYVNLATARASLRAREVAMRKVLGASRTALIGQFLGEAIATVAIAALLGLMLAEMGLPLVNAAGGTALAMPYGWALPLLAAVTLVVGLIAGFYPALVLSRFPAAAVLASARAPGGGKAGARLREALVVLQFGLAIAFLIGTVVMTVQMRHLREADLGFRREGLITIASLADPKIGQDQARALIRALQALPGVRAVGTANNAPGGEGTSNIDMIEQPGPPGTGPMLRLVSVGPGFFDSYRPRLLAGRLFDDAHAADDASDWKRWPLGRNVVLDRRAVTALGFRSPAEAIGKTVGNPRPRTIIGVIDELRFLSPRTPETGTYYMYTPNAVYQHVGAVRFTGDPRAMLDRVQQTWRRVIPWVPFRGDTADRRMADLYAEDERAMRLVGIGTGLAVLIGCVGLWGLAAFSTARRVKEIGIRKTLGASAAEVARLLVGQFLRPVLLASLLAWPLAWAASRAWLAGFGDRIPLSPLYFLGASLIATAIAVLTVLGQSLRASRASPAWALRSE
ncbi:ABC transporter permease [Sphingomonas pituitosa]|uniref:ABC transporter permease n=1 Tax=Sphingomonas pituitosa TaxID=99597 RepID=UPI00082F645D|nr:ABC transporter permease [Sphingomonas pituitosa]